MTLKSLSRRVLMHISFIMVLVDYIYGFYQLLNDNYLSALWMWFLGTALLYTFSTLSRYEYEKKRGESSEA
mgnify:CR=1 FL=1